MSKRNRTPRFLITPELRSAVIAAVRKGESGTAIAARFGICRSSVTNIARGAGIIRGVKVPKVPDELGAEIAARYAAGESGESLGAEFGYAAPTIRRAVRRSGGTVREACRVQRPLRHDAFDELSPAAAYWLGMLFTDGTIQRRPSGQPSVALGLKACDRGHLVKFRDFLGSDHAITERAPKPGSFGMSGVQFSYTARSQSLADRLDGYGRYSGPVSQGLVVSRDFWRGCIDGDGCLNVSCGIPTLKLFGSERLLTAFVEFLDLAGLRRSSNGRPVNVRPCQSIFAVGTSGMTAVRITRLLYADAAVALDRKAVTAAEIIKMEPPFIWPCNKRPQGPIQD